jgi:parallel beta-helix repeat protein
MTGRVALAVLLVMALIATLPATSVTKGNSVKWVDGTLINPVEAPNNPLVRMNQSISTKFTVWYDATNSVYRAESNVSRVSDSNSSSFATALNYAIATGGNGSVRVRPATTAMPVTSKISLRDNVIVFLDKGANPKLCYNGDMFEMDDVQNGGIVGGHLHGDRASYTGSAVVIKGNSSRCIVQESYIYNFGTRGISIEENTSSYNWIMGNRIYDVVEEGIYVSRSLANRILHNSVEKTGYHGIVVTGGNNNAITSNIVRDAGGNHVAGFAHGIAVDGNEGFNPAIGNIVANNEIYDSYMCGIEIADQASNTIVSGNYVDTTIDASAGYGIYAGGSKVESHNITVVGNVVFNAADIGIFVAGTATNLTTKVIVKGNVVDGSGDDGIRFKYATNCVATDNICDNNPGYGLALEKATKCAYILIHDNNFRNNTAGTVSLKN